MNNYFEFVILEEYKQDRAHLMFDCIQMGKWELVAKILDEGIDIETIDGGYTPLQTAAIAGYLSTVKGLILRGANINAVNYANETPLILAIRNCKFTAAKFLLNQKEIDLNVKVTFDKKYEGFTALMITVDLPKINTGAGSKNEIIRMLLAKGANPNIKNDQGEDFYDMADAETRKFIDSIFPSMGKIKQFDL